MNKVVIIPNVFNCPSVACLFVCLILLELSPLLLFTVVIYCCFCYATGFFFFFCSAILGVSAVAVWQVVLLLLQSSPPALTALARRLSCGSQWDTESNHTPDGATDGEAVTRSYQESEDSYREGAMPGRLSEPTAAEPPLGRPRHCSKTKTGRRTRRHRNNDA